jgi:hypothetical protein
MHKGRKVKTIVCLGSRHGSAWLESSLLARMQWEKTIPRWDVFYWWA